MIYWVRPRYEHLGWKSITFQSGYKPEKEKTYKIEIHNVQSFQNETIVFSLLFSMENEKHVPDVDDYDGDNSLASLFLSLLCGALPGVTLAAASRRHWVMWETSQKATKNCGEIWAVFGEDLPSSASFQKQRLFLLCRLGRASPSPRPAALSD